MPDSFIDTSSLNQVVQAFALGAEEQYPWSVATLINTTVLLLGTDHQHLPPLLPGRVDYFPGELEFLKNELLSRGLLSRRLTLDANVHRSALTQTRRWAACHASQLNTLLTNLFQDSTNFQRWLDWAIGVTWNSPDLVRGHLFDIGFAKYIAQVLAISAEDVEELHHLSRDEAARLEVIKRRFDWRAKDFRTLARAYTVSFLLRGKYHDTAARLAQLQISQHALRSAVCVNARSASFSYRVSNSLESLARIIVFGAASSQRTLRRRLACWTDNICRVRPFVLTGEMPLAPVESDTAAWNIAAGIAKRAGVEMGGRRITRYLDHATAIGIGVLTDVFLQWYVATPVGLGVDYLLKRFGLLKSVGCLFHNAEHRLRDIGSGRIAFAWDSART
jgi:hypothetical protein